jgi:valyl-tRNA synthetase
MAHPLMPFVTEEIWSYLPGRESELIVSAFPKAADAALDEDAEAEIGAAIELTRDLRRWRELAGVAPGAVLAARAVGEEPNPLVARLARIELGGEGEALATVGPLEILPSADLDEAAIGERLAERRRTLESEVKRAEGKLGNEGFVAKAPAEVVAAEREKLERYRAELAELSG